PAMRQVFEYVRRVAGSPANVLIVGESGTGKDLIAQAIHGESGCAGTLVPVNCAAIPDTLMEGEFFGAKKGAYTDAKEDRAGLFEQAADGTLFLDEVAEIPLPLQGKLLRVLQDHKVRRLGDQREVAVTARIVSATNRDLAQMVAEGSFREDLYYRLNVIPLTVPALRERRDCLLPLLRHYIAEFAQKLGVNRRLGRATLDLLLHYDYPGNVRELMNLCERLVVMSDNEIIGVSDLPPELGQRESAADKTVLHWKKGQSLNQVLAQVEYRLLAELKTAGLSQTEMAAELGVNQSTIARKLKKHGLL
ncbi:MAG: sigma-54 dependent transcriptional regulator, partial [Geopsychrobacter sp.]|nr:sigma-54 dependent transcriptional regulator [Geopsychrobacter sp.]